MTDRPRPDGAAAPAASWVEVRWRQFRHAPRPVVRAVAASLSVAVVLAVAYLAYDVALSRGVDLPGGDLRTLAIAVYVVLVLVVGSADHVAGRPAADRLRDRPSGGARGAPRSGSSRRSRSPTSSWSWPSRSSGRSFG